MLKQTLFAVLAALGFAAPVAVNAATCKAGTETKYITKRDTLGAIRQERAETVKNLLDGKTLNDLVAQKDARLQALIDEGAVERIAGGVVMCAETQSGFFLYAKRAHLASKGIWVWVPERELQMVD